MKTKYMFLGLGALVVAAGLWFGPGAWRAHHQLVSLNVRNAPLTEVLRKIERQTGKNVRAEKSFDARITLHVVAKPLWDVLDRLAEQAGAHWSTLYAVYDSTRALSALDSALSGDGKLEPAGWTKLAPSEGSDTGEAGFVSKPILNGARPITAAAGDPSQDGVLQSAPAPEFKGAPPRLMGEGPAPDDSAPMPGQGGRMMFRGTRNGPVIFMGPNGQVERWSPEELVMESALSGRLGSEHSQKATAEGAAQIAQTVNARWTTYLAFTKSSMGIGFAGPPRPGSDPLKRGPNDRFARLTPEQRVQRARQRLNFNPQ